MDWLRLLKYRVVVVVVVVAAKFSGCMRAFIEVHPGLRSHELILDWRSAVVVNRKVCECAFFYKCTARSLTHICQDI